MDQEVLEFLKSPDTTPAQLEAFFRELDNDVIEAQVKDALAEDLSREAGEEEVLADPPYDLEDIGEDPSKITRSGEGPLAHERAGETVYKQPDTMATLQKRHPDYVFRDDGDGIEYKKIGDLGGWWALDPSSGGLEEFGKDIMDLRDEFGEGSGQVWGGRIGGSLASGLATAANPAIAPYTAPPAYLAGSAIGGAIGGYGSEAARQRLSTAAGFSEGADDPMRKYMAAGAGAIPLPGGSPGLTKGVQKRLIAAGADPRKVAHPIQAALSKAQSLATPMLAGKGYGVTEQGKKFIPDVPVLRDIDPTKAVEPTRMGDVAKKISDSDRMKQINKYLEPLRKVGEKIGKKTKAVLDPNSGKEIVKVPGVSTLKKTIDDPMLTSTKTFQGEIDDALTAAEDHVWGQIEREFNETVKVNLEAPEKILQHKIQSVKDRIAAKEGFATKADKQDLKMYEDILDDYFSETRTAKKTVETGPGRYDKTKVEVPTTGKPIDQGRYVKTKAELPPRVTGFDEHLRDTYGVRGRGKPTEYADEVVYKPGEKAKTTEYADEVVYRPPGTKIVDDVNKRYLGSTDPRTAIKIRTRIRGALQDPSLTDKKKHALQELYGEMTHAIDASTTQGFKSITVDGVPAYEMTGPLLKKRQSRYRDLNTQYAQLSALRRNLAEAGLTRPDFSAIKTTDEIMDDITTKRTRRAADNLMNMGVGKATARKEGLKQDLTLLDSVTKDFRSSPAFLEKNRNIHPEFTTKGNIISALKTWQDPEMVTGSFSGLRTGLSGLAGIMAGSPTSMVSAPVAITSWLGAQAATSPWLQKKFIQAMSKAHELPVAPISTAVRSGAVSTIQEAQPVVEPFLIGGGTP